MGAIDTAVPDSPDATVDGDLVQTIEAVEESDFLVLNGDSRTWEVTDVVDRPIEEPADDRLSKRVLRLASRYATFGLELVEYPDCHEATLHVLESNDWAEVDQTYAVDDVQVLDQQVPWVVVGNTSTYHFRTHTRPPTAKPSPPVASATRTTVFGSPVSTRCIPPTPGVGAVCATPSPSSCSRSTVRSVRKPSATGCFRRWICCRRRALDHVSARLV